MNDKAIVLKGIRKAFAGHVAVSDLSLEVPRGSVFGLLGPERRRQDDDAADGHEHPRAPTPGTIEILGQARRPRGARPHRLHARGARALPAHGARGAARLHGRDQGRAPRRRREQRLGPWLERLGLADWRKQKTNELSKGMQQKAQFIATVLHEPDVLIMDEPMSGLDPVGMDVMREVMLDLRRTGTTIVLSSHQMETVERLCDRVALINRGEKVLDGSVSEVKARHGKNTVVLAYDGDGSFLDVAARGREGHRLRPVRRGAARRTAPTRSRCCGRPRRGSGCAASRSSSRACTTSSSRP